MGVIRVDARNAVEVRCELYGARRLSFFLKFLRVVVLFAARVCGASVIVHVHDGVEKCEGCRKPATGHDSEGVPLCDECGGTLEDDQ